MKKIVFVSISAGLLYCLLSTQPEVNGQIYNGQDVKHGQFKFMAALVTEIKVEKLTYNFICGGTIIGSKWILTAAHCLDKMSKVIVYLGALTKEEAKVVYKLDKSEMYIHRDYNDLFKTNDIALLRIPMTEECDKISFARLPFDWIERPENMLTGMIAIAIGWGRTSNYGPRSKTLQWTRMVIISNDECRRACGFVTDNELCAISSESHSMGEAYGSPCYGDSGGPLVLEYTEKLIGVTQSISCGNCENGTPVHFVRVVNYLPWISEITGITS